MRTIFLLLFLVGIANAQDKGFYWPAWGQPSRSFEIASVDSSGNYVLNEEFLRQSLLRLYARYEQTCEQKSKTTWDTLKLDKGAFVRTVDGTKFCPRGSILIYPKQWEITKEAATPTFEGFIQWLRKKANK